MIVKNAQFLAAAMGQTKESFRSLPETEENSKNYFEEINFEEAKSLATRYDVRNISPREMAAISSDLYQEGKITFQQQALLSFQPELHPEYNATLGVLSGPTAQPDQVKNIQDVLNILKNLEALNE